MQVTVLEEHGYDAALRGMSYSFKDRALDLTEWWDTQRERATQRAPLLAAKDGGHNKFLESIQVWVDVEASRAWWGEFDTYRVGMTKQSESTMHTLQKREPTHEDFETDTPYVVIKAFIDVWPHIKDDITTLKLALPEGFLQRRVICTNYKVLRNIVAQRNSHRFTFWERFVEDVLAQVQHPEFLR